MERYTIEGTTLTNIANAIRSKTGSTEPIQVMEMANEIGNINGTGEDVTAETNEYTVKITQLESVVTALETELEGKASGGSGGGSIPTYTLTIESDNGVYSGYACTVFRDGAIAAENTLQVFSDAYTTPHTIENVVCNSLIAIGPSYDVPGFSITNGSLSVPTGTNANRLYIISATGGSNVTLRIYDND